MACVFLLLIAAVLLDHLGCFGYRGDDLANLDGRSFVVSRVTDRAVIVISPQGRDMEIQLLGVEVPKDSSTADTTASLSDRVLLKSILLKLDPLQPRDAAGRLAAFVYLTESDCLNVDIVRDGLAYADRRQPHAMRAVIEGAEADAKKHRRGLWETRTQNRER